MDANKNNDDPYFGMGSPEECMEALRAFQAGFRPRPYTPEEEAAMNVAIAMHDAQRDGYIATRRDLPMTAQFERDLADDVLRALAHAMDQAAGVDRCWAEEDCPGSLLDAVRGLRDAAWALTEEVERWWPSHPPRDFSIDFLVDEINRKLER